MKDFFSWWWDQRDPDTQALLAVSAVLLIWGAICSLLGAWFVGWWAILVFVGGIVSLIVAAYVAATISDYHKFKESQQDKVVNRLRGNY